MISIVIPCFNEETVLPQIYTRLSAVAPTWGGDYEILLVDDGSTDRTWEQIRSFHCKDARWKGIRLARNFGQQAALGAGLQLAQGNALIFLDADLQDPPELIAEFIARWQGGAEVVYGIRAERPEGRLKQMCYAGFYWLLVRSSRTPLPAGAGDFGLVDRKVVRVLRACKEQRPFWRGLRGYVGFKQVGVPYSRYSRQAGSAQYTLKKLLQLASDGFWSLTTLPLDLLTAIAVLATLVVLLAGSWVLPGERLGLGVWVGLILGCVNLFGLAVMGRYLARVYDEVRRRPRWIIADRVGFGKSTRRRQDVRAAGHSSPAVGPTSYS